jgi:RNA-directed DNA polymerase
MTQYPWQLHIIEGHIRRRLRARIVSQQKRPRNIASMLKKNGINKQLAHRTAYSNHKTWFISHTKAMEKAYPVKWFVKQIGQLIISDKQMKHWFNIEKKVRLT